MSLNISLYDTLDDKDCVAELNWLRNPYGLGSWAADNYNMVAPDNLKPSLWYVVNNWSHEDSNNVDRKLFLHIVQGHWEILRNLESGYFIFDYPGFVQFIAPKFQLFPKDSREMIKSSQWLDSFWSDRKALAIPMEHFTLQIIDIGQRKHPTVLSEYKIWFAELLEFAELLQNEQYRFHCTR